MTPRTSTACSRGSTPRHAPTTPTSWQYEGTEVQSSAGQRDQQYADRTGGDAGQGGGPRRVARLGRGRDRRRGTPPRRDDAAPPLRVPGAQAPLRPLHARRWSSRSAASRRTCSPGVRADHRQLRPRPHDGVRVRGRLDAAHGRRAVHPHGRDPPDAARQHRAGPAAESSRCAATRSIQGSTDIPTLFNILPGLHPDAARPPARGPRRVRRGRGRAARATGANMRAYTVSLLKAYWGDAATEPRTTSASTTCPASPGATAPTRRVVSADATARARGYFVMGENPAVGSANAKMQRLGMAKLDWLVVRDFSLIESATWWKDGPEIESGELRTEDIGTEVFFLPAAAHTEKDGSFTNTQRLLQWHHAAVEPAGDARSELWFMYHLGRRIREKLAGSTDAMDRPVLDLTWDYPTKGSPRGTRRGGGARRDQRMGRRRRSPLVATPSCADDGSTTCGCWIYCGVFADGVEPGGAAQAGQRAELGRARVGLGVAGEPAHPLQPRVGRPRRQAVERAQGVRLVGRGPGGSGPATTSPTSRPTRRPTTSHPTDATGPDGARRAATRSSCRPTARRGCSHPPDSPTARCRRTTNRRSRRSPTRCTGSSATRPVSSSRQPAATTASTRATTTRRATSSPTWRRPTASPSTTPRAA